MQENNKALVALIMAILIFIEAHWGFTLGISEEAVIGLLALLTPILVWLVPNRTA